MLYILLPVHNRKDVTEKFIKLLKKQTLDNFYLVLIDDGSTDNTDKMVLDYFPNTILLKGNGNLWWGGALELAFQWLCKNNVDNNAVILIINDDVIINSTYLETGIELLEKDDCSLLGSLAYNTNKQLIDKGLTIEWNGITFNQAQETINCLSTRGLFFKMKTFKNIGGFYPHVLPHYLSDYEFTTRAYNKGYKLITNTNLTLIVDEGTTGIRDKKINIGIMKFFKNYFSKRSVYNPIYYIIFIILSSPKQYIIKNITKTIFKAYKFIKQHFTELTHLKKLQAQIQEYRNTKFILYGYGNIGKELYTMNSHSIIDIIDKKFEGHLIDAITISSLNTHENYDLNHIYVITILNKSAIKEVKNNLVQKLGKNVKIIST